MFTALIQNSSTAVENNELSSIVLEPVKSVAGDKTKIENLLTRELSNSLFASGYGVSFRDISDG